MRKSLDTALKTYRDKRRFAETHEPPGGAMGQGALYLIQKHAARRLHYDFRLELDGVLLSWAVTRGPSYNTRDKRLAVRTEDHPLEYGQFEGTIPAHNYGAGTVMLWDSGTWEPVGDARQGLEHGKLAFVLHGERLRGRWALVRMRPDEKALKAKRENWLLIKENDEYANKNPDLLERNQASVVSGRTLEDIASAGAAWDGAAKPSGLPAFQPPMLATLVEAPPSGADWIFEIKYDGYRAMIAAHQDAVKIFTRSGLDWTGKFPQIAKAAAALRLDRVLIDSEIVVIDAKGRTDFAALVTALESGKGALSCLVFDILCDAGEDCRDETLRARKARLRKLMGNPTRDAVIQVSEDFSGRGKTGAKLLQSACAHGLEGIIAKRADAPYRGGRRGEWLKIKCGDAQEFVVIGFAPSLRRHFASILLAVHEGKQLRYAGRVGSGISQATLQQLSTLRDAYQATQPPCPDVPDEMDEGVIWVKPVLIAQVKFSGWTRNNRIRHGRFIGLRGDKKPEDIVKETPDTEKRAAHAPYIANVQITHGERAVFPEDNVRKADVAAYLQRASEWMMPYIEDRFVSFLRCPQGAAEKCFFQRHPSAGFGAAWISRDFTTKDGTHETYMYCETPEAIIRAVQMGVLEFHIWGSKVEAVEKPDRIVFDLDPDDAVTFDAVKEAAFRLRDVLAALALQSLPLLSGGKGIHVVAPIRPQHEWPVVKQFAHHLADRVVADAPEKFLATMSKAKRRGKIFIDHFRNEIGATAIAPYSPRARKGAAVAWPLTWTALKSVRRASAVSIPDAVAALEAGENGWAEYGKLRQELSAAALRALDVAH